MRPSSPSCLATAASALLAAILATTGCQTAQKNTFLPPSQAQAPALKAASSPSDQRQSNTTAAAVAAVPASKPAQPSPAPDPVADLITRVEKEYKSGQDNYQAGQVEAAQQNFDSAINLLLASGFELSSDNRLEQELDRILEGINALDLTPAQSADTAAEQKSEPAPIDEANELTPAVDQNVKAKAEAEIKSTHSDLPLMMTDQVAGFINYFSNRGRGTVERALARSGRYEDMIRRALKEEGVPQDLIYLAQAESGFHPLAVSRAGARGMWQFMGSRAKGYGLERSWWIDDRQDPEKATRAAAHHLKDLYNEFGDWYLAMAAYNSGPGTVQSAVKRTGYADFWELYRRNVLPKETRNYVPIIVAVTIMAKNPAQYGLDSVTKDKPVPYDTVKIHYSVDLRLAAECVDATTADLLDLNPSLLRLTTPKFPGNGKDGQFELHVPAGTAAKFQTAIAGIPVEDRLWWRYHKVRDGETLASIARTYHTSPKLIVEVNGLADDEPNLLNGGLNNGPVAPETHLIIPVAPGKQSDTSTYARATTHYKIRKGDTVETVAENFAISPKMIRGWNHIKGSSLAGRKVLYLHLPVTRRLDEQARETEVATRSKKHAPATHHPAGTETASASNVLHRPAPNTSEATNRTVSNHAASTQTTSNKTVLHHKVKPGETLYSIASSYNTTITSLKRDNQNIASLRPGMILVVHTLR